MWKTENFFNIHETEVEGGHQNQFLKNTVYYGMNFDTKYKVVIVIICLELKSNKYLRTVVLYSD